MKGISQPRIRPIGNAPIRCCGGIYSVLLFLVSVLLFLVLRHAVLRKTESSGGLAAVAP
jgi:hypothetical protein